MTRRILAWSQVWLPTDLWRAVQELGRAWRPRLSGAAMLRHLLERGLDEAREKKRPESGSR